MKTISKCIADWKDDFRKKGEENVRGSFSVAEKGGSLWLTHFGVAFKRIDNDTLADDIATFLDEARDAAVEFEKL